ncbi:GerMN domain-containing protein [Lachnospiraceae bacterium 48-21]
MKKRILILVLAGMFCLTACDEVNNPPVDTNSQAEQQETTVSDNGENEGEGEPEEGQKKDQKSESQGEGEELDKEDGEGEDTDNEEEKPAEPVKINVYCCNEDASGFSSKEVEIASQTPEAILGALLLQNAVPADTQILNFEKSVVDGADSISLDLNSAFADFVYGMGSSGEYYAVGSVCNTFLDAYSCEKIQITIEGAILEGHASYTGYMTRFQ